MIKTIQIQVYLLILIYRDRLIEVECKHRYVDQQRNRQECLPFWSKIVKHTRGLRFCMGRTIQLILKNKNITMITRGTLTVRVTLRKCCVLSMKRLTSLMIFECSSEQVQTGRFVSIVL